MKKIIIALLALSTTLVSCDTKEETTSAPEPSPVVKNEELTDTTAKIYVERVHNTLIADSKTEKDFLNVATNTYLSSQFDKFNVRSYDKLHTAYAGHANWQEHDVIVGEKYSSPVVNGNSAQTFRDVTMEVHSFDAAPQTVNCEIRDSWVKEDGTWKLDTSDRSRCDLASSSVNVALTPSAEVPGKPSPTNSLDNFKLPKL